MVAITGIVIGMAGRRVKPINQKSSKNHYSN